MADTQQPIDRLAADFAADGWRECPNAFKKYARCFYKRFETPTRCHCNDDKPGIQIEAVVSKGFADKGNIELTLSGELRDGSWVRILNYCIPNTHAEAVALIPRLLAIWEAANAKP